MICAVCNKESNNRRVCPYCFTPYPEGAPDSRQSTGTTRQSTGASRPTTGASKTNWSGDRSPTPADGDGIGGAVDRARALFMRQTPVMRWSVVGIATVAVIWMAVGGGSGAKTYEGGTVPSNIIATPMQREEAIALVKYTRETALVDTQADEVFVSYPAATFPLLEEGQVALAQQFARADEIVEGRRRRIFFYNPSGRIFAQSDGVTGVTVIK